MAGQRGEGLAQWFAGARGVGAICTMDLQQEIRRNSAALCGRGGRTKKNMTCGSGLKLRVGSETQQLNVLPRCGAKNTYNSATKVLDDQHLSKDGRAVLRYTSSMTFQKRSVRNHNALESPETWSMTLKKMPSKSCM